MAEPLPLSDREREILQCIVDAWQDANYPMYAGVSYREAMDLLQKLGVRAPGLEALLAGLEAFRTSGLSRQITYTTPTKGVSEHDQPGS